jgi:hypothetical protein
MFNAEISAGALMVVETKQLARILLNKPTKDEWRHAIEVENVLQKKTPATAKRQAILIKKRLDCLSPEVLESLAVGDNELTLQLTFASSLLHSQLHHDFMIKVYGDHIKRYEKTIGKNAWINFWEECNSLDSGIAAWSELTKNKLYQVIIKILAQAKYLDSTKLKNITPPYLHPETLRLIKAHHPQILNAMEFKQ